MTTVTRPSLPPRYRRSQPTPEVVAALVDDSTAEAVARAAVRTAKRLGARVRFLQMVVDGHRDLEATAASDHRTFLAAMEALQGSNLRGAFEVVSTDATDRLVEIGAHATRLVLWDDRAEAGASLVARCLGRGICPVQLVTGHERGGRDDDEP